MRGGRANRETDIKKHRDTAMKEHMKTDMKKHIKITGMLMLAVLLATGCTGKEKTVDTPYVIMMSMDGFRWDYTEHYNTPNFDRIKKMGIKAESMMASFPTKTFPNHYTIATGLYPNHHGLVNNSFWTPSLEKEYRIKDRETVENPNFYGGEPIWVTAEKQDITSASYFWVGSEAPIKGIQPTYWKKYKHKFPFEQRLDTVIHWLSLPEEERPHLITWYVDQPDSHGHRYGPNTEELRPTIEYLDSLLGAFMEKAAGLPISNKLNIIITSDHGMGPTSSERRINITKYLDTSLVAHISGGNPVYNIFAKEESYDKVWEDISTIPNVKAWKSAEIPQRLNYGSNPRCGDFVLTADSAWSISLRGTKKQYTGGTHGYDNQNRDMHAIFYAYGPAFKQGYSQPTFNNIDIYPLICEILGINPAPVDGSLDNVASMLK